MKQFTIEDIRSWRPCYDPSKHLAGSWSGTVVDILQHDTIPPQDKLWVVCREDLVDAKTLRLFAVWCARSVEHLLTDDRSRTAIAVAERFANGEATTDELKAARDEAWDAVWDTAGAAARVAVRDAVRDIAETAAWAASGTFAGVAVRDAVKNAVGDSARDSARETARDAARAAQVAQLLKMVMEAAR